MLLERERDLAVVEGCLPDGGTAQGRMVLVEGPAGIGKTALLGAARTLANDRGVTVLSARGVPLEQDFSFGVVRQLFEPVGLATGQDSTGVATGAASMARQIWDDAGPSAPLSPEDLSFSTLHGLYWLTANLASRRPLLLAVDDCHWADRASLRFLAHLGTRLDGLPVLVAAAVRTGEQPAAPELVEGLMSLAGTTIRPSPLGASAVARVVRTRLATATDRFCHACHVATGGNPLLLNALTASFIADGGEPDDEAAGRVTVSGAESVARLLRQRLTVLPAGADALVRALAVLGDGSPLRHLAALAGLDFEHAARLTDRLRAAEVLAPAADLAFAHPILRAAAEETMGSEARALAHARAAAILAAEGAPPDRLALHYLHTHPRGDDQVVAVLRAAASVAVGRGSPEPAVTYLRRALDEPPARESRGRLLVELGLAELVTRRHPDVIQRLASAVAMIDSRSERLETALAAGRAVGILGHFADAAAILGSAPGSDLRIEAELAAISHHPERLSAALHRLADFRDADRGSGPGWELMQVMQGWRAMVTGEPWQVSSALIDRALAGTELFTQASSVAIWAALILAFTDRLDDAERLCSTFVEEGRRRGALTVVCAFAFPRAVCSLRRGLPREAEADARLSLEAKAAMGWDDAKLAEGADCGPPWPAAFLVEALTDLGDVDGAETVLAQVGALVPEPPEILGWAFVLEARGRLRIAQGHLPEGVADLLEAGRRWDRLSFRVSRWREDAALGLAQLGDHARARQLATEQLDLAHATGLTRLLGTATRVAGAVAPRDTGLPLLREAVELLAQAPARLELARARLDLGAALRRDGHRVEAREHLKQCLELAHRAGAAPLAARARDELLAAGGRPRKPIFTGVEALTSGELRVARLAAEGRTNREIAERLFVTQRTVETHLRHVFQKLDISTREQLPGKLDSA